MRFGVTMLWSELAAFRRDLRSAEAAGMDRIGIGDSPTAYRELYVSLAVAAMETERVRITPMVQVPLGRHPALVAAAVSSLQELSGGRAGLVFGTGATGAAALGRRSATLDELREYVGAVRGLLRGDDVEWDGRVAIAPTDPRPVPIEVAANGPRAARAGGAIADVVVLGSGPGNPDLPALITEVRAGAAAAGRDADEVGLWLWTRSGIADDRQSAMDEISASLAATGALNLRTRAARESVPGEYHEALDRLSAGYDLSAHAVAGGPNARLLEELGLVDYLAERYAIVGSIDDCREQLRPLAALGISGVQVSSVVRNPAESLLRYGELISAVRADEGRS